MYVTAVGGQIIARRSILSKSYESVVNVLVNSDQLTNQAEPLRSLADQSQCTHRGETERDALQ
jgi:hypothetical protein